MEINLPISHPFIAANLHQSEIANNFTAPQKDPLQDK